MVGYVYCTGVIRNEKEKEKKEQWKKKQKYFIKLPADICTVLSWLHYEFILPLSLPFISDIWQ